MYSLARWFEMPLPRKLLYSLLLIVFRPAVDHAQGRLERENPAGRDPPE
jgi:hypothetical protein